MADADIHITGRPGGAIATLGPGATHVSAGANVAAPGSTPLRLLVGLPGHSGRGRAAFHD